METEKNERLNRTNAAKSPVRQDGRRRAAKYNYVECDCFFFSVCSEGLALPFDRFCTKGFMVS